MILYDILSILFYYVHFMLLGCGKAGGAQSSRLQQAQIHPCAFEITAALLWSELMEKICRGFDCKLDDIMLVVI